MSGKTKIAPRRAEANFEIRNSLGLHLRPAKMLADLTNRFQSEISITKDLEEVNGKSIMGIITLAAAIGEILKVTAVGPDAQEAVDAVGKLIENKFGEED
jgi:phosphocarrier protein HPr